MDNKKQLFTVRLPKYLFDKLQELSDLQGFNRTESLIYALDKYFMMFEDTDKELIELLDEVFDLNENIFIPEKAYKYLFNMNNKALNRAVEKKQIVLQKIKDYNFVVIPQEQAKSLSLIEILNQKKELMLLQQQVQELKNKINN